MAAVIPTVTAIVAGLIGYLTVAYVGYIKQKEEAWLESQKFQTSLILEAVKTGDPPKALENLTFFIDAGFLYDSDGAME